MDCPLLFSVNCQFHIDNNNATIIIINNNIINDITIISMLIMILIVIMVKPFSGIACLIGLGDQASTSMCKQN